MCYEEGVLQAFLDKETDEKMTEEISSHLNNCSRCREMLNMLEENRDFSYLHLTTYKKQLERIEYSPKEIINKPDITTVTLKGVFSLLKKYKRLAGAAAAAACIAVLFSFAPVRTFAAQFLTLFRVQNVEKAAISVADLNKIQQAFYKKTGELNIEDFGKLESDGFGQPQQLSWNEAFSYLQFIPLKPQYMPEGLTLDEGVQVSQDGRVSLTLDVKNVNAVINQIGGKHFLPASLDGGTFTFYMPESIQLSAGKGEGQEEKYIDLIQTRSPEIKVPENVDVEQVREAILDLPVIPEDVRQKLASLDDWQHTLYVPEPERGTVEQISINGVKGVMMTEILGPDSNERCILIWQKDGICFSLAGYNIPVEELIRTADSIE